MLRPIHPLRDWQSFRTIDQAIRDWKPDVVHTHSGKAGLLGRLAAHRANVPAIVHTVHGAPFHKYQPTAAREFFRRCEIFSAQRCHRIVSVADAMTDQLVTAKVAPREKFTTIYSGIETDLFLESGSSRDVVRRELGFQDNEVVVTKVARLFHLKGHEDFIRAAELASARCSALRFLLVGDGILRESLQEQVDRAGLTKRFRFTGLVPPLRIPGLLSASDIIVHASYREGLARVLPQALLCNRPVVSYDIDGAREVVCTDKTGFLVVPGDIVQLAERICALAEDRELRFRLASAGQEVCQELFNHHFMTASIRDLYLQILN